MDSPMVNQQSRHGNSEEAPVLEVPKNGAYGKT